MSEKKNRLERRAETARSRQEKGLPTPPSISERMRALRYPPPKVVTLTGYDQEQQIDWMVPLSRLYPEIEWAVLWSQKREGTPRYPKFDHLLRLADVARRGSLSMAVHLCGDIAHEAVEEPARVFALLPPSIKRVQVNINVPCLYRRVCAGLTQALGERVELIFQCRGSNFPDEPNCQWLFDASGGRGVTPEYWPPNPGRYVGYAGGLGPDNVRQAVKAIASKHPYWIDMESSLRGERDEFSLEKCRRVLQQVYGNRTVETTNEVLGDVGPVADGASGGSATPVVATGQVDQHSEARGEATVSGDDPSRGG